MNIKSDLFYTKDHEWLLTQGDTATIGITDHAQSQLGDIVFVELPEADTRVKAGDTLGVVESTKAVSDFYSPVEGMVVAVNTSLTDSPETINKDSYGEGWLVKMKFTSKSKDLMDAKAYEAYLKEEHK